MLEKQIAKIKNKGIKIVFPEAMDERVVEACVRLKQDKVLEPILIGDIENTKKLITKFKGNPDEFEIIEPTSYEKFDELVAKAVELRKGKWDEAKAKKLLSDNAYFATMLVATNYAHGLVGGATYSTANTIRPAFQLVKTKGGQIASSYMIMEKDGEKLFFADCAINPDPTSEELAQIAEQTAENVKLWNETPNVAMLSFSTKGSASHDLVDKVEKACEILKEKKVKFNWDGTFQFDSAYVEAVRKQKAPDSPLKGKANIFVFPDLNAGNIGYKIAQRLGGWNAVGPVIQGLNKPINDLSRGCSVQDVYDVAIITANQS